MNPNGRQYKLGGTLDSWVWLSDPTPAQVRALRRAYRGLAPKVYGRYGHRQWRAAAPGTRLVVKDPYAVLSIDTVARVTAAVPVLVYRHPAAVLSSYRRMGWQPDVAEVAAALNGNARATAAPAANADLVTGMAWFWSNLNELALDAALTVPGAVVVDHAELASGGTAAMGTLFRALGLSRAEVPPTASSGGGTSARRPAEAHDEAAGTLPPDHDVAAGADDGALHRLDRRPEQVATAWRATVDEHELELLSDLAGPTLRRLESVRLRLS